MFDSCAVSSREVSGTSLAWFVLRGLGAGEGTHLARPIRMYGAGIPYFVTVRCLHGRLFLRPSDRTNEVLGGVLARAARLAGIEVFAFVFASNHVHLLVRGPPDKLPSFMQYLLTNISKKIGALVGWRGAFWERRYSAEPVLDEEALLGRIRYILSHGVKEGLVATCQDWPGLSSLSMMLDGEPRRFRWFH
jgi:REP element-mobilizing transposase RayT